MLDNDQILFDQIKKGDKESFDTLFRSYYSSLCNFALVFLHSHELAEEIVQESFIKLWDEKEKINIVSSVKFYLFKIVKNKAINYLNQNKRKNKFELDYITELKNINSSKEIFSDTYTEKFKTHITNAIDQLPDQCKTIFILSRIEGLSHKEISTTMNLAQKTIENQITIALKKLRELVLPELKKLMK